MGHNIAPEGWFSHSGDAVTGIWWDEDATPVERVWRWDEVDGWVPVWTADPIPPDAATAVAGVSQVTVDWTLDEWPGASSYVVRRPDGSFAGEVAHPATLFVDDEPRPLLGTYRVHGKLDATESVLYAETNSSDLRMPAQSFTATHNSGTTVDFAWTGPVAGTPDSWVIFADVGGGEFQIGSAIGGATSAQIDAGSSVGGHDVTFSIRAVLGGVTSTAAVTDTEDVPARPPSGVSMVTGGGVREVELSWSAPAGGQWTGYEVAWSDDGVSWSAPVSATSPATHTVGGPDSGVRYGRVRATSGSGASTWVTASATPIYDVDPPDLPTINSLRTESQYGRMVLRWTHANDDDLADEKVEYRINGGSIITARDWTSVAKNSTRNIVLTTTAGGSDVEARISVRDQYGNAASTGWATYTVRYSPTVIDLGAGATYRQAGSLQAFTYDQGYEPTYLRRQGSTSVPSLASLNAIASHPGSNTRVTVTLAQWRLVGSTNPTFFLWRGGASSGATWPGRPTLFGSSKSVTWSSGVDTKFVNIDSWLSDILDGTAATLNVYRSSNFDGVESLSSPGDLYFHHLG